jgi:hypothetical protein
MARTVELWMHPAAGRTAQSILITEHSRSLVRRSMALFDSLVANCRKAASAQEAVHGISPAPLAIWVPSAVTGWPSTPDGREMESRCRAVMLCVYQLGSLRSIIGVVEGSSEWYVVWLQIESIPGHQDDFGDDSERALAQQLLYGSLGLLTKLEWLEAV